MLTPEQKRQRMQGITATDFAKIVTGVYGGAIGVWASKLGLADPVEATGRMVTGQYAEIGMVHWYAYERADGPVYYDSTMPTIVGDEPWMMATPDAHVIDGAKCKTGRSVAVIDDEYEILSKTRYHQHWRTAVTRLAECKRTANWARFRHGAPQDVWAQCQWQMRCTDVHHCDVVVDDCGEEYRVIPLTYDADFIAKSLPACRRLWRKIERDRKAMALGQTVLPPEPDWLNLDQVEQYLALRFHAVEDVDTEPNEGIDHAVREYLEWKQAEGRCRDKWRAASAEILHHLGHAKRCRHDEWIATRVVRRGRVKTDWPAVISDLGIDVPPEVAVKHTTTSKSSTSLRITDRRDK
jgi:hypothetical protein